MFSEPVSFIIVVVTNYTCNLSAEIVCVIAESFDFYTNVACFTFKLHRLSCMHSQVGKTIRVIVRGGEGLGLFYVFTIHVRDGAVSPICQIDYLHSKGS